MAISREELRAKRLKAMSAVGEERQATADMYDRITEYRGKVADAREAAERVHMADMDEQIRDLKEDYEELQEFAQAVPPKAVGGTAKPAGATTQPGNGSAALAALMAAQPNPPAAKAEESKEGDAYVGTSPPNH